MFGYIVPLKQELRMRELAQYNAYYCGLCTSIGARFGQAARLTLNYDSTFLAMLLTGLSGGSAQPCIPRSCGYKPFQKKRLFAPDSDALRFSADFNVALAWHKLRDDWQDEKKASALAGKGLLRRAAKQVSAERPNMVSAIEAGIRELSVLERERCNILDAPADCFALLMRAAGKEAPLADVRMKPAFEALLYNIGKWVYLADAWEDRERDARTGAYNVFNVTGAEAERAGFLMHYSINEAIKAYELLDIAVNREILDNILYDGCAARTQKLLGGKHEQSV